MATDMFVIYQINDAEKNREYRCRSYAYQIEHGFMITTDNYEISYWVSVTLLQSQRQERPHFNMWTKKHW